MGILWAHMGAIGCIGLKWKAAQRDVPSELRTLLSVELYTYAQSAECILDMTVTM